MEEWKDIEGYEGIYQVSNLGLVRTVHGKIIKLYTTLNAWYSDDEDAEVAFDTAARFGKHVTSVAVDHKRYKMIGGKVRRIANMEALE